MMKKNFLLILISFSFLFFGCSPKKGAALFSNPVSNQPATLILSTENFLGSVPMGNTLESKVTVRANGGLDIYGMSPSLTGDASFTYKGGSFPGTGGTCTTKMTSGKTCDIVLSYTPTAITTNATTLSFTYADTTATKTFSQVLEADSHPILTFEHGTRYDFGNKFFGSSTELTITITNSGRAPANSLSVANLTAPFAFKNGSYPGTGGTCGTSVGVGSTCNLVIVYAPTVNGQHLQDIALNYTNAGNAEQNILNLTAWGLRPAVLSLSDAGAYNFGTKVTGMDHDKVYTLTYVSGDVSASAIGVSSLTAPFNFKGGSFPGTGGTCTSTMRSGSCTIVVTMNTSSSGTWSNNFSVAYYDGKSTISFARTLQGITKQKPVLSLTPNTTYDFGLVHTAATSATKTYTLTYVSGELPANNIAITGLAAPFYYAGVAGTFPGTAGTCSTTLSLGSCTIVLVFKPTTQSSLWQSTINFNYNDYIQTISQAVTLQGSTESKMNFSSATLEFGNRVVTTQFTLSARILFTGGIPATTITPTAPSAPFAYMGAGIYPGTSGSCGGTLSSDFCDIYFTYTPVSGASSQVYTLSYYDGFANQNITVNLTGTGVPPALLTIPNSNFGSSNSTNSQFHKTITITNSSTMNATAISAQALPAGYTFKNGTYPGVGGTCGSTLVGSASCNLVVTYNPTAAGTNTGNLTLNYNNGVTTTTSSGQLTGSAVNTNELFISNYDTYDFTTKYLTTTTDKTFTISHGGGPTTVTVISPTALPADYSIVGGTCGATLVAGATCTFIVRFAPLTIGTKAASFTINYNNGTANTSVTRLLTGVGRQPAILTITPNPHDYGLQPIGVVYERIFTVTSSGPDVALTWTGDILGSGFTYKGGAYPGTGGTCSSNYVAATCTIVVIFSPTAVAPYSGTARIRYNNRVSLVYATVDLAGTGKGSALLSFSNASPYDFGNVVQTTSAETTLTLNNTGTVDATAMSASVLSGPYSYKGGTYPGTGGTCGDTLAVGACTIVIKYTPTTTGLDTTSMTINYNNGTIVTQLTMNLNGLGVSQAVLSMSDGSPYAYGSVVVGSTLNKTFTVTNGGETQAANIGGTFTSTAFIFKGGSYPGTGGTCASTLNAAANCTIVLSFAPTSTGGAIALFKLNYDDGLGTQTEFKNLSGTGIAALKASSFMAMIPIQSIETGEPSAFFEEALTLNGDFVQLSDGSLISGRDTLLIQSGLYSKYYQLLDDNIDITNSFSSWGLSKLNIGDIDGDSIDDVVISRFNPDASLDPNDTLVFTCHSGKDMAVLYTISLPNPTHLLVGLSSITIPQDIDGDGHNDFITGLYQVENNHLVLKDFIILSSKTGLPINYK